ncbi:uncharacterized protein LOC111904317 [Lactuca sativa]|uniref:AB hydrolase-1 domain-containing protein n=1 Tax=Lactuca sativa TaxID=4236 RepID=A0A9R1X224_LACSA|nr:uncharacterized protein LOC111904317 [Lactuca sativa]KAJ0197725.1 hypothetical protein LSAT_V11C700373200 [Lactuca sativa]
MQEYLEQHIGVKTRRQVLYKGYVEGILATGMQSNHGFDGQVNACWTHRISKKEVEVIGNHGLLISVIHGRCDVIAQISHPKRLAHRLYPLAKMVELPGGHLVSHERSKEVNEALPDLIKASETKTRPFDWTNLSPKPNTSTSSSGCWTSSFSTSSRLISETESTNSGIAETN